MNFKTYKKLIVISGLIFIGCEIQDIDSPYIEKIAVFANIQANLPILDTLFVSRTAAID